MTFECTHSFAQALSRHLSTYNTSRFAVRFYIGTYSKATHTVEWRENGEKVTSTSAIPTSIFANNMRKYTGVIKSKRFQTGIAGGGYVIMKPPTPPSTVPSQELVTLNHSHPYPSSAIEGEMSEGENKLDIRFLTDVLIAVYQDSVYLIDGVTSF